MQHVVQCHHLIGQVADSFTRFLSLMRLNVLSVAHNGM